MWREELFQAAKRCVKLHRKEAESNTAKLWNEPLVHVAQGWLKRPPKYAANGELAIFGGDAVVNPACRFGAQQSDGLRPVDDQSRGLTPRFVFPLEAILCRCSICFALEAKSDR